MTQTHIRQPPPLQGTFMQLSAGQTWNTARLAELFRDFTRLQLSHVIVQRSVDGRQAFYKSSAFDSVVEPPVEAILTFADAAGVKVRVGLADDPQFWQNTSLTQPVDRVNAYLQGRRARSLAVARDLAPVVRGHRSFEGWFLTDEIDDTDWLPADRRAIMRAHLDALGDALNQLTPTMSIGISGFSNAQSDPATLQTFWAALLDGSRIDVVFFQDGIGAHKLRLENAGVYLAAVKRAATTTRRALSIVVELFEQTAGPPVSAGPFAAAAAPMSRVLQQLALARDASTAGAVAFSVPDYMARGAGPAAFQLFTDYTRMVASESSPFDDAGR